MSDDASKFDPRFDPAFQRGFDGPVQATPRSVIREPATTDAAPIAAREAPAEASRPQRTLLEPTPDLDGDDVGEARRPNPFVLGLLGAAVLLVAGGLYLVSRLSDMFANPQGSAQYDYITLQALTIAAPMLIVLGVATGIGVLFIYAVRWKRA